MSFDVLRRSGLLAWSQPVYNRSTIIVLSYIIIFIPIFNLILFHFTRFSFLKLFVTKQVNVNSFFTPRVLTRASSYATVEIDTSHTTSRPEESGFHVGTSHARSTANPSPPPLQRDHQRRGGSSIDERVARGESRSSIRA